MLHGRTQGNIAPRRRKVMQYVETDRQENGQARRRFYPAAKRDDGASANVPYQEGKDFERGNRSVRRYPPRFSATSP
ncbi:hypothetical protein E2H86_05625 [Pseudomonas putida]|nr:hypothetical protein E2H86_05625 [Pseudomonas putida]